MGMGDGPDFDHSSSPSESASQPLPKATETALPAAVGAAQGVAFTHSGGGTDSAIPGAQDPLADNDALAAIVPTASDSLANIQHTLDQLATATDLFDVPALDFDGTSGS
jgi:hypothetical protein